MQRTVLCREKYFFFCQRLVTVATRISRGAIKDLVESMLKRNTFLFCRPTVYPCTHVWKYFNALCTINQMFTKTNK